MSTCADPRSTASLHLLCESRLTKGDELPAAGSNTSIKFTLVGGAFSVPVPGATFVIGIGSRSRRVTGVQKLIGCPAT